MEEREQRLQYLQSNLTQQTETIGALQASLASAEGKLKQQGEREVRATSRIQQFQEATNNAAKEVNGRRKETGGDHPAESRDGSPVWGFISTLGVVLIWAIIRSRR